MENQEFKGVWIPKEIWNLKNLGWTEKLLFVKIDSLNRQCPEGCYATNEHLANYLNITKESASRLVNKLVKSNLLISKIIYKSKSKQVARRMLLINWDFLKKDSPDINIVEGTTPTHGITTLPNNSAVYPLRKNVKENNKYNNNKYNNKYIYAQNRPEPENEINSKSFNCSELFERFYKIYPKKKGKHKAYKWFKTHKPNAELVGRMIEAVKLQMRTFAWRKSDGAFIPYPTSWLNSGGWENEVSPEEIADTSETSVSRFLAIELYEKLKAKRFESTKENEKLINSWALEIESYLSVCRVKEREDRIFYAINQIGDSDKWRHSIIDAQSLIHNIDFIGRQP